MYDCSAVVVNSPKSVGEFPVPRLYQSWLSNGSPSAAAVSRTVRNCATSYSAVAYT
jgi:hypothetical protein